MSCAFMYCWRHYGLGERIWGLRGSRWMDERETPVSKPNWLSPMSDRPEEICRFIMPCIWRECVYVCACVCIREEFAHWWRDEIVTKTTLPGRIETSWLTTWDKSHFGLRLRHSCSPIPNDTSSLHIVNKIGWRCSWSSKFPEHYWNFIYSRVLQEHSQIYVTYTHIIYTYWLCDSAVATILLLPVVAMDASAAAATTVSACQHRHEL